MESLYSNLDKQKKQLKEAKEYVQKKLNEYETPLIITEGKTDWKHIKAALHRFQYSGKFQTLKDISFLEYEDEIDMGDKNLASMCIAFSKTKQNKKTIFIFDRDNKNIRKEYAKNVVNNHGNNVYSFCIPEISSERDFISIEFYYEDSDLKTLDENNRRLFIGLEFYLKSGNSKCGKFQAKNKNKVGKLEIIDNAVYEIEDHQWNNSVALTKNNFARYIYENKDNFKNFNIDNFNKIFKNIEQIILDR